MASGFAFYAHVQTQRRREVYKKELERLFVLDAMRAKAARLEFRLGLDASNDEEDNGGGVDEDAEEQEEQEGADMESVQAEAGGEGTVESQGMVVDLDPEGEEEAEYYCLKEQIENTEAEYGRLEMF